MDSHRLKPLQQLAQEREQAQMRQLAECHRVLAAQEKRLEELAGYRTDYAHFPPVPINGALLANRRAFIDRLDKAMAQQKHQLKQAQEAHALERSKTVLASRQVMAWDQLAKTFQARERHFLEKRMQNELDAHAARPKEGILG